MLNWLRIGPAPGSYEPVVKSCIAQMARNLMSSVACAPWNQRSVTCTDLTLIDDTGQLKTRGEKTRFDYRLEISFFSIVSTGNAARMSPQSVRASGNKETPNVTCISVLFKDAASFWVYIASVTDE